MKFLTRKIGNAKVFMAAALVAAATIGLSGCADGGGSYAGGYGSRYYAPDYGAYYGDYGYAGNPYWGGGSYYGGEIVVGGVRHRGYYGGHHFAHQWSGGSRGGSVRRGAGWWKPPVGEAQARGAAKEAKRRAQRAEGRAAARCRRSTKLQHPSSREIPIFKLQTSNFHLRSPACPVVSGQQSEETDHEHDQEQEGGRRRGTLAKASGLLDD
jgi:hypothetical protein